MGAQVGIDVFTTRSVCEITRILPVTLTSWIRLGLVTTSVLGARGRGSRRVFSFRDVVALRVASVLREHGVELTAVAPVVSFLQAHKRLSSSAPLRPALLAIDGAQVLELDALDSAAVLTALVRPNNAPCTILPLHEVVSEVQREARRLRLEAPPKSHKSENRHVRHAAARARAA